MGKTMTLARNMICALASTLLAAAQGREPGVFYVDAVNGDDALDGSADYAHCDAGAGIGPRKTLVGIMEVANTSGDVVYAAPGRYDERAALKDPGNVTSNRVVVPQGVRLESTDGAESTFIVGAAAVGSGANGLGSGATRCVALNAGSAVVGFTLTGGRTASSGYPDGNCGAVLGAGQYAVGVGYVVSDCIVSNNLAGAVSCGSGVTWVRCRLVDNGSSVDYCQIGQYYHCYFRKSSPSGRVIDQPRFCYGCTIYGSVRMKKTAQYVCTMYNSIVYKVDPADNSCGDLYDCLYYSIDSSGAVYGSSTQVSSDDFLALSFDSNGRTTSPLVVDCGNSAYVRQLPVVSVGGNIPDANIPEGFDAMLDLERGQRIYNGRVDLGACEYDIRADVSAALADERVAVTNLSANVTLTSEHLPVLTNESTVAAAWTSKGGTSNQYGFSVKMAGPGVLSCYKDGESEPFETVICSGGELKRSVAFTSYSATVGLSFAFAGDGSAVLSGFVDEVSATITDSKGGLSLTGIESGKTVVTSGEPLTFTISRNFTTDRLCTGFVLNGTEFVDFDDYPGGWTYTLDSVLSSVVIEAQYKTVQDFYVDPVNGDDGNSGFLRTQAWKTLATISTNGNVRSGDVVYALPGIYSEGSVGSGGELVTSNRVVVPPGVRLESTDGAESTFIVGAAAPGVVTNDGCGSGAIRCVALGSSDAELVGFTLTGGRTSELLGEDGACAAVSGGPSYGSSGYMVSDCIISNCIAKSMSVGSGITWIRCSIVGNAASWSDYNGACQSGRYFNCYIANNKSDYPIYLPGLMVNCTIVSSNVRGNEGGNHIYNSIIQRVMDGCVLHDCAYVTLSANTQFEGSCTNVSDIADFCLDGEGRPSAAFVRDAGVNDWLDLLPADVRGLDRGKGQRIYNGTVDLGAWEFDKRPDFAHDIGKRFEVPYASTNVVETQAGVVRINGGQSLSIAWKDKESKPLAFSLPVVVRSGTLAVMVNGSCVANLTSDGVWRCDDPNASDIVTFSFTASEEGAYAELSAATGSGLLLIFR